MVGEDGMARGQYAMQPMTQFMGQGCHISHLPGEVHQDPGCHAGSNAVAKSAASFAVADLSINMILIEDAHDHLGHGR